MKTLLSAVVIASTLSLSACGCMDGGGCCAQAPVTTCCSSTTW